MAVIGVNNLENEHLVFVKFVCELSSVRLTIDGVDNRFAGVRIRTADVARSYVSLLSIIHFDCR